jgi:hypothetical protein
MNFSFFHPAEKRDLDLGIDKTQVLNSVLFQTANRRSDS